MRYFFKYTVGKYTQFLFVCPAGGGEIAAVGKRQLWKSQERKQSFRATSISEARQRKVLY